MSTEKEHKVDREHWPPGPWNDEPDKVNWTTKVGFPGMIVRSSLGGLCGYVAVAKGHPAYGQNYDDVNVDVHGGLTYADACSGTVCHVPEPGEPDNVWWLGFDCCHAGDWHPPSYSGLRDTFPYTGERYRDIAYVTEEVESLAKQLAILPKEGADG